MLNAGPEDAAAVCLLQWHGQRSISCWPSEGKKQNRQKQQQLLVGFALETNNLIEYAAEKVKSKNLDLIIANSAIEKGAGFGTDTNKITIIDKHNKISNFELKSKQEVAIDIVNYLIDLLHKK